MTTGSNSIDQRRKKVCHFDQFGHAHFLTFSCYRRLPLLSKDRTRRWFVDALRAARSKHHFDLWAWVLMPEHVHLVVWPRRAGYRMASILADVKRPVGQQAIAYLEEHHREFLERLTVRNRNRTYRRFWQAGPGQDRNIYDPAAAHEIIEYVHDNPVRRGLVSQPEDWPWSSAAEWAGRTGVVLNVDRTIPPITQFPR